MPALFGGHNLPLQVEIRLTDQPKSGGAMGLQYAVQIVNTNGQLISEAFFLDFKSPKQQKMGQIKKHFIRVYLLVFIIIECLNFFLFDPF